MEFLTSDGIYERVKDSAKNASKSLKLASAWIRGKYFEELIDIAKSKNLDIQIILRASEIKDSEITDARVFRKIKEAGGHVYLCDRLHAKFLIIDESKVVLGSANYTDSGLSDISTGNIEVGAHYSEDPAQVKQAIDYFEKIKNEYSYPLKKDLVGFVLNPVRPQSFEFILLEPIEINSYVKVDEDGEVLGRVSSIYSYNTSFFANPFSSRESEVLAPISDFKKIFSNSKDPDWRKFAIYSYLNSNSGIVEIATVEVVGKLKDSKLDMPQRPFEAGKPVYKASEKSLEEALKSNSSGFKMEKPIPIGKLKNSDTKVYFDASEVLKRHLLVVGTTGSGKSYFVKKKLIPELSKTIEDLQIIVFDAHGEYYEEISPLQSAQLITFEESLFPVYAEQVQELIKEAGFARLVTGNSNLARDNSSMLEKYIRPSVQSSELCKRSLEEILNELKVEDEKQKTKKSKDQDNHTDIEVEEPERIKEQINNLLKELYGENALSNQQQTCDKIKALINSDKKIVIADFSRLTDPETRTNIAGLVLSKIFNNNKTNRKRRLVIIEEAHNFAPERGYGDTSSGKENLSLIMIRKIASEGRKFNLGLAVITQRPAQVSKYVLSQLNTQVLFRIVNSSDLETLKTFIEQAREDLISGLSSLTTGNALISGTGVPFSTFFEVVCQDSKQDTKAPDHMA
ncbi:MAG: DUF87 domain-containing protein [Aquificaceae bacterium]